MLAVAVAVAVGYVNCWLMLPVVCDEDKDERAECGDIFGFRLISTDFCCSQGECVCVFSKERPSEIATAGRYIDSKLCVAMVKKMRAARRNTAEHELTRHTHIENDSGFLCKFCCCLAESREVEREVIDDAFLS